jgi:hypothetical protein
MTMHDAPGLKATLKRGALIALANWPLVAVQFIAESIFKIVLAVPVIGGMLLVDLVAGDEMDPLAYGDLRERVAAIAGSLLDTPAALFAFVVSFALVLLGGSALLFLVKGGTVTVLADAEAAAGAIERPPLRWDALARAGRYSIDRFVGGCVHLFARYLRLGLILITVYLASGGLYLVFILAGLPATTHPGLLVAWTVVAAFASGALIVWITLVNLMYLLTQMIVAVEDVGVREAARRLVQFLRGAFREIAGVFGVILLLVLLATAVSVLATAGLGLISFVPLAGLAVIPLQLAAWLVGGIIFQYLGLTALGAYLTEYRAYAARGARLRIA